MTRSRPREPPRIRLWIKVAAIVFAVIGVNHFTRQLIATRITSKALAEQQALLGQEVAKLVAEDLAEPLLLGDQLTMDETVSAAVSADSSVAYCFVADRARVLASSFPGVTPHAIFAARAPGTLGPLILERRDGTRILDVAAPILDGRRGIVRLGLSTDVLDRMRRDMARQLEAVTILFLIAGLGVAFVVGRHIAKPVTEMLRVVDGFDPSQDVPAPRIVTRGSDELTEMAARLEVMMVRLRKAHVEAALARERSIETERLAALGTLTAGLAHEINNPLAGLKNCIAPLERGDLPEPKRREYLRHMRQGLDRIANLVQRLLDFGRRRPLELAPCSPADLAADAIQLVMPLLRERRIECTVEPPPDDASGLVRADRHEIGHALVNLLLNAAYVTREGGRIAVRLGRRGELLGIAVADDGPGIPPELRRQVLDPFFTTKPVGEGTGLGLSVTRAIVDAHGGELDFEFPERGGTVAAIWLPRVPARGDGPASRA